MGVYFEIRDLSRGRVSAFPLGVIYILLRALQVVLLIHQFAIAQLLFQTPAK